MVAVIIIDDDSEFVDSLCTILELHNIEILDSTNDGSSVLALYEKHKPDFVITDYDMPECDGLQVIDSVKKFDPKARIILVSGFISDEIRQNISSFESVTILEKPFDLNSLLKLLK